MNNYCLSHLVYDIFVAAAPTELDRKGYTRQGETTERRSTGVVRARS
jgi:hypothetical protein